MSENTYLEQYLNQVILPRYLHNWLMEALNEVKVYLIALINVI